MKCDKKIVLNRSKLGKKTLLTNDGKELYLLIENMYLNILIVIINVINHKHFLFPVEMAEIQ